MTQMVGKRAGSDSPQSNSVPPACPPYLAGVSGTVVGVSETVPQVAPQNFSLVSRIFAFVLFIRPWASTGTTTKCVVFASDGTLTASKYLNFHIIVLFFRKYRNSTTNYEINE